MENAKKFFEAFEEMRNYVLKMEAKKIKAAEEVARKEKEVNLSPPAAEGTKEENDSEKVIDDKMSELTVKTESWVENEFSQEFLLAFMIYKTNVMKYFKQT